MNNTTYTKSKSQIDLERILHSIKDKGLTISQLKNNPENTSLNKEFFNALTDVINVLVHEKSTHNLITSIARSYSSQYYDDQKEYDILFEVISQTFLGLNSVIKKSAGEIDHSGRIRIDTYLDKDPELFVFTLRSYLKNNILLDLARNYGINTKHVEADFIISNDNNESISKLDLVKYNNSNIESNIDFADSIVNEITFRDNMRLLIDAIIDRFCARKPVAGYVFLSIINDSYDPRTVVSDLRTKDFNQLFHKVLRELESTYNIDLSKYDNIIFNADKYLSSFRTVTSEAARARIDRLASQTRKDVQNLETFKTIKANYETSVSRNRTL